MTKVLYSASSIATILQMTKQGINKAAKEGRIPAPSYRIGNVNGWTLEQLHEIKQALKK